MTKGETPARWPDFFIAGAPKAGTTALHSALMGHPQLWLTRPKEPKYFLRDGTPPPRTEHRGPGDAHSRQEWVWRTAAYTALWEKAPEDSLVGESTPFYLADLEAHRRIAAVSPAAKFVVLLRDPVDRAYSNWMHLWSDGLEPVGDFLSAVAVESERQARGWAPFWRYRGLGRYGEQLANLYRHFPREQVLVLRYRDLVDRPLQSVADVETFLGVEPRPFAGIPRDNTRPFRSNTTANAATARALRLGANLGSYLPPQAWRSASVPLLRQLHRSDAVRPHLSNLDRELVRAPLLEDLHLLDEITGRSFEDWRTGTSRGSFVARLQQIDAPR